MSEEQSQFSLDGLNRIDADRIEQVQANQEAIEALLEQIKYDAILLTRPENMTWFTAGGDLQFQSQIAPIAAIFIKQGSRVMIAHDSVSPQLFDREASALGFQLKERPWSEPLDELLDEICRGRSVASDSGFGRTRSFNPQISKLRQELPTLAQSRWLRLGQLISHMIESTCRHIRKDQTEADVAGQLAHRLIQREIQPTQLQVITDRHLQRYPWWSYSRHHIQDRVTLCVVGKRHGVHYGTARTCFLNEPTNEQQKEYQAACWIMARVVSLMKAGVQYNDLWNELQDLYAQLGYPDDWRRTETGLMMGFHYPEQRFDPNAETSFRDGTCWMWKVLVGNTLLAESFLIKDSHLHRAEFHKRWPMFNVTLNPDEMPIPIHDYHSLATGEEPSPESTLL